METPSSTKTPCSVKATFSGKTPNSLWNPVLQLQRTNSITNVVNAMKPKSYEVILTNTVAILVSVSILFLLNQIYNIFLPCLKALLWALLCGSALYPFKQKLHMSMQSWLNHLVSTHSSLSLSLVRLPFKTIGHLYLVIINFITNNQFLVLLFFFRFQIINALRLLSTIVITIVLHNRSLITVSVILIFTVQMYLVIFMKYRNLFSFIPTVVLLTCLYSFPYIGLVSHIALTSFLVIAFLGFVYKFFYSEDDVEEEQVAGKRDKRKVSFSTQIQFWLFDLLERFNLTSKFDTVDGDGVDLGKQYMSVLFTIFVFVLVEQIEYLPTILLSLYLVHLVAIKILGFIAEQQFTKTAIEFGNQCWQMKDVLADKVYEDLILKYFIDLFMKGDKMIQHLLSSSLHLVSSLGIMLSVSVLVILFSVLLSVKIYGECYSVVHLLRNELSSIEYIQEGINMTINQMADGDYLKKFVKNNVFNSDKWDLKEEDKALIDKVLMDFGDNITSFIANQRIVANVNDQTNLTAETSGDLYQTGENFSFKSFGSLLELVDYKKFHYNDINNFVQNQAQSYLPLFKSFLSIVYTLLFVILDGGSVVFNFFLNFIIFALTLFYLLSSSGDKYKPIEFLDTLVACLTDSEHHGFSRHVEEVINSIFAATLKISAFYGINTWLLHSLFNIQVCCIPSVAAALLAAVPILTAYWASLPACIYLYYFDTSLPVLKALAMFFIAIMPSFIVDSSIYSDIKRGGHPYLTGLAITCGVVYYGFEGALFGPLWLSFLVIILSMVTSLTEDEIDNSRISGNLN